MIGGVSSWQWAVVLGFVVYIVVSALDSTAKWYNINPRKKYAALLSGIGVFILLLMTDIAAIVGIVLALGGLVLEYRN